MHCAPGLGLLLLLLLAVGGGACTERALGLLFVDVVVDVLVGSEAPAILVAVWVEGVALLLADCFLPKPDAENSFYIFRILFKIFLR